MSFADFFVEFSNDEIRELADAINANEVAAPNELELREILEDVPMEDRQDAAEEKPEIIRLFVALGLTFRFREELEGGPVTLGPEDEPDVRVEEVEAEPEEPTQMPPSRGRIQPESGRPRPFGAEADKELAERFFAGNLTKGQAWVSAEQERLSRHSNLDPLGFWNRVGDDIWGAQLTVEEFVNPRQSAR